MMRIFIDAQDVPHLKHLTCARYWNANNVDDCTPLSSGLSMGRECVINENDSAEDGRGNRIGPIDILVKKLSAAKAGHTTLFTNQNKTLLTNQ